MFICMSITLHQNNCTNCGQNFTANELRLWKNASILEDQLSGFHFLGFTELHQNCITDFHKIFTTDKHKLWRPSEITGCSCSMMNFPESKNVRCIKMFHVESKWRVFSGMWIVFFDNFLSI